ncbi:chromosome partitioning protein ParA [Novosphingobium fuchskuhlense]|uniref:Chromosome partitioning protein ParA n=1 Tax=Novosphingobium fuchskuhlense TaxID=1117702 RepID=A0A124JWN3_9SPHN|nr:ParA family partition ATPase [Novosphingobium fuchskuhlense]KUR73520.1 chromosome partitioning protein ParA [Novosphingobium fuchskuhlense]
MTTIAIVSQKGGAGKTTLAINLAAAAERTGEVALIIDADPQATASQWAAWREEAPPEVIDSAPPRIAAKVEQAKAAGATFIVIDTPPHADSTASKAMEAADLVLIPCRPSAFDLAAIRTTARLVQLLAKPAWVVFTAGPAQAERIHAEAAELVASFGVPICPYRIADRAAFRHASAAGRTAFEIEPDGKAAREIERVHMWACEHVNMATNKQVRGGSR